MIMRYLYRGEEDEFIPDEATHITVAEDVTFVRARAFRYHPNIIELICHDKVEKIEEAAFSYCPSLKRIALPGVKVVECAAFSGCKALTDVECDKLEIIKVAAFSDCYSLRSINLPSARIVESYAFRMCEVLTEVKFGSNLQRVDEGAFKKCTSLERLTLPLKDDIFTWSDNIFSECHNLVHVDPIEGEIHQIIAALQLEEWRNHMNEEIVLINQILPNADAGSSRYIGEKTYEISMWISEVLAHLDYYKAEHLKLMKEATTLLELALWKANLSGNEGEIEGVRMTRGRHKRARKEICVTSGGDIVIKNVLPFLALKL